MYVATAAGLHALRHSGWLGRSFATASTAVGAALNGRVDADGCIAREGTLEAGITAVSAPVRAGGGSSSIVAALSVVGPTFRLKGETLAEIRRAVDASARQFSTTLSHQEI